MRASHLISIAAAGALAAAALAGCSSSSGGGSSAADSDIASQSASLKADTCGMGNGQAASGTPIKIGAIASMSNGIDFRSSPATAKAYFDCVNANGGINGRPIAYTYEDDALDPQKSGALATKFADDKDVVAMAGGASFVGCGVWNDIYKKAGLYDILGVGVPKPCFFASNMAAMNAGPRLSAIGADQYYVEGEGKKVFGELDLGLPGVGDWVAEGTTAYLKTVGGTKVIEEQTPPALKDAAPYMTQIKDKKPEVFGVFLPAPNAAVVLKAAEQQKLGETVRFTCQTPCYDTTFPSQIGAYWNDKFTTNSEFTLLDAQTPDNLNWRAILQKYGTADQPRDSFSQAGYLAAKALVDTLLKMDPNSITRENVGKAIVGIADWKSDILCKPWNFGAGDHHNANNAIRQVKLDASGKYVVAKDCFQVADPELADLVK